MIRMAVVLGIACVLSISIGCLSPKRASTPTSELGWSPQGKPDDGFVLDLPPTWKRIYLDPQTLDALMKAGQEANPQMGATMRGVLTSADLKDIRYLAFDFSPDAIMGELPANVSIVHTPAQIELPVDFLVQMAIATVENTPDIIKPVTRQSVQLRVGQVEKVQYRQSMISPSGKAMTLVITWYMIVKGKDTYILILSATADHAAKYAPIFEQIAQSFRLIR